MTDDQVTREEFRRLESAVNRLADAYEQRREAETPGERRAAEAKVETEEERLEKAARAAGVSVETLKRAAKEEEDARVDAAMDRWAERHNVTIEDAQPSGEGEGGEEGEGKPTGEEEGESKGKGPKVPPKPKPTREDEKPPETDHWYERKRFVRGAKTS